MTANLPFKLMGTRLTLACRCTDSCKTSHIWIKCKPDMVTNLARSGNVLPSGEYGIKALGLYKILFIFFFHAFNKLINMPEKSLPLV